MPGTSRNNAPPDIADELKKYVRFLEAGNDEGAPEAGVLGLASQIRKLIITEPNSGELSRILRGVLELLEHLKVPLCVLQFARLALDLLGYRAAIAGVPAFAVFFFVRNYVIGRDTSVLLNHCLLRGLEFIMSVRRQTTHVDKIAAVPRCSKPR